MSVTLCVCVCAYVCVCVCSGKHYGCIVRKKVMLLEELKRDTPEFGGFGCAVTVWWDLCVCFVVCCFLYAGCFVVVVFSRALTSMFLSFLKLFLISLI